MVSEKAPVGLLTFHLTGDLDMNYVRNPERVKKAQDEQKRIDAVAAEIAAEMKKATEERTKADKDVMQASVLCAVLGETHPGALESAVADAPRKARRHLIAGLASARRYLEDSHPRAWEELRAAGHN